LKWNIPDNLDYRYMSYVPKYTLKYFYNNKNLTGFLDDIWHGVSAATTSVWHGVEAIPKAIAGTGYVIAKHNNNVQSAVNQGVTDINKVLSNGNYNISNNTSTVKWHDFGTSNNNNNDFWGSLGKTVGGITGDILQYKIMKAAGMLNQTPEQVWNESLAWSMAHRQQLENMGYPSPEAATTAALWANNGYPPAHDQQPSSIFGNIEHGIEKYWWVLLLVILIIIMNRR